MDTRERLLKAAGIVFAEKGFFAAKTAEICRLAGANIAAVNYHFRSKERLYAEAWRHAFERSIEANPPDGGVSADAPPEERLRGHIQANVNRIAAPDSIDFDISHKELANPTGLLAEVMKRSIDPLHRMFMDVVRELLNEEASEMDVHFCAISVHSQCLMPLVHERNRRRRTVDGHSLDSLVPEIDKAALVDHILRFSLAGIRGLHAPSTSSIADRTERKVQP
ncbi:CerR family C-terminal domain-containing protein [bacterium]|nr:CerR family C-terminal domain-containing protein [candidate division CSSED10-310 bacterium]